MARVRGIAQLRTAALKQLARQRAPLIEDVNPVTLLHRLRAYPVQPGGEPTPIWLIEDPIVQSIALKLAQFSAQSAAEADNHLLSEQQPDGGDS